MAKNKNKDTTISSYCLISGCGELPKSRGLCGQHYAIARGRVKSGKLSWGQLEILGLSMPVSVSQSGRFVSEFDEALSKAQNAF